MVGYPSIIWPGDPARRSPKCWSLKPVPRSTYYDAPPVKADDAAIVAIITAICDEFEAYGYRRVSAEVRH